MTKKRASKFTLRKTLLFNSYAAYDDWWRSIKKQSYYETVPVAIDDGWNVSVDLVTKCKS